MGQLTKLILMAEADRTRGRSAASYYGYNAADLIDQH